MLTPSESVIPGPQISDSPPLPDLTGQITLTKNYPSGHGGFANVWIGVWRNESNTHKVAVKVLRATSDNWDDIQKMNKRLRRELRIWKRLKHENVLELHGITSGFGPYSSMICPWQENGNLTEYLKRHGEALLLSHRFRILSEVTAGLSYLHSFSVVHGDLTGGNVLINSKGNACLSDFGLSTIAADVQGSSYFTSTVGGALRWTAPELYRVTDDTATPVVSTYNDIYSFGSITLQALTTKVPYHHLSDIQVFFRLIGSEPHPQRPPGNCVTDQYWDFINKCWASTPHARPAVDEVARTINLLLLEAICSEAQLEKESSQQIMKAVTEPYETEPKSTRSVTLSGGPAHWHDNMPIFDLTQQIELTENYPSGHGRLANVWTGVWRKDTGDIKVAVKILRAMADDKEASVQKMNDLLRQKFRTWKQLEHENMLQLYGITSEFGPYSATVCPWQENGNLTEYLKRYRETLSLLDRLQLLCEIAAGLSYLHSLPVVHGNLTGSNVLISSKGVACLSDVGFSSIATEAPGPSSFNFTIRGALRWTAPELCRLVDDAHAPSIDTPIDIYSFGSVMLQTLSGKIPYFYLTDVQVLLQLTQDDPRPKRPSESWIRDEYWTLINQCWAGSQKTRPPVTEVAKAVAQFLSDTHVRNTSVQLAQESISEHQRRIPDAQQNPAALAGADWHTQCLETATFIESSSKTIPYPFLGALAGTIMEILQMCQRLDEHREIFRNLVETLVAFETDLHGHILQRSEESVSSLTNICDQLNIDLSNILKDLNSLDTSNAREISRYLESNTIRDTLARHRQDINEFRNNFLNVARITEEFSLVPELSSAVVLFSKIITLCESVTSNRYTMRQLRDRCHSLLLALRDSMGVSPAVTTGAFDAIEDCFRNIQSRMNVWANTGRLISFTKQTEIHRDIEQCHLAISGCLANVQSATQNWQHEFHLNSKRDHQEVIEYLSKTQNLQKIENGLVGQGDMLRATMEIMQSNLNKFDPTFDGLSSNLYQLQLNSGELLPSLNLRSGEIQRLGQFPVSGTGSTDIYEGLYLGREKVAIKVIRSVLSDSERSSLRRFKREAKIWGEIWKIDGGKHVLPFYGFCLTDGPYPYMISPWQKNGVASQYVKKQDNVVDYRQLIRGISFGLQVLHTMSPPVVHGDVKGDNILIDNYGKPLLSDFGLSQIVEDISSTPLTQSRGLSDSYRWFAPEVCVGQGVLSTSSDVYMFAMTILELMTHHHPYADIKRTPQVIARSSKGEHPLRPTEPRVLARGLDDELWHLLVRCWAFGPSERPSIQRVLDDLP